MNRRLTAKRVSKLREAIARNRCPERPGITHDWRLEYFPDCLGSLSGTEEYQCRKCGAL